MLLSKLWAIGSSGLVGIELTLRWWSRRIVGQSRLIRLGIVGHGGSTRLGMTTHDGLTWLGIVAHDGPHGQA